MEGLVDGLNQVESLAQLAEMMGGEITPEDILQRMDPETLARLGLPAPSGEGVSDVETANLANREEELGESLPFDDSQARLAPPDGMESGYFYRLQMRETGPGGGDPGRDETDLSGEPTGKRGPAGLPRGDAAAERYGSWRSSRGPRYDQPDDATAALQRLQDPGRGKRDAEKFKTWATGTRFQGSWFESGPCPTCGGSGQLAMGAQMRAQAQGLLSQAQSRIASLPDVVRDGEGRIIRDNRGLKASLRQQISMAQSMLNASQSCPTCNGRGRMSIGR